MIPFFADERDAVQKKTFTKWVNKHLIKVSFIEECVTLENEIKITYK